MNYETDETPSIQADHSSLVYTLVKDPVDILDSLDYEKMNLIHAILGVSGEAGELLDAIKKHCIYNKPLDVENVIEELGDLEFYLEQLRQILNISREDTLTANILKLRKRYPSGYTDKHAQQRLDKIEQK
jgi:NTP pyrophosphatase (non-canonical NTP hydrolase)